VNRSGTDQYPLVAVVGPCSSGKSSLVCALKELGHNAREVAQEHSLVADLWQRFTHPDVLVFVDVSWQTALSRRPSTAPAAWRDQQKQRLRHARSHADIYICTDKLTLQQVAETVAAQIMQWTYAHEPRTEP